MGNMQVMVNGLLTNYQLSGEGPLLLVLHGWGDEGASWRPVAKHLAKHFQVLIPDLPGFGGTAAPSGAWGLNDYAQFIAAFLKKIEATNVEVIIGHSNGGAIAIRGLAGKTLHTKKLVLLASAGIRSEYKGRKKVVRLIAKAGKGLTKPLPAKVTNRLRRRLYTTVGSDMLVAEHLQETFKRVVSDDVQADAKLVAVPSLLLYGDQDVATPPRYGELFKQALPHAELVIIPGATHFLHQAFCSGQGGLGRYQ